VLICLVSGEFGNGDKRVEKRAGQIRKLWVARTKSPEKEKSFSCCRTRALLIGSWFRTFLFIW
jgi:hypothetical protein